MSEPLPLGSQPTDGERLDPDELLRNFMHRLRMDHPELLLASKMLEKSKHSDFLYKELHGRLHRLVRRSTILGFGELASAAATCVASVGQARVSLENARAQRLVRRDLQAVIKRIAALLV